MKTNDNLIVGFRSAVVALMVCVSGAGWSALRADELAQPVDEALRAWLGEKPGGVVAAVVTADKIEFFSAGKFSKDDPRAVGPETRFEIGSITKTFTGLLAVLTEEERGLTRDGVVGAPFASSEVTYAQLLTHTSGLPSLSSEMVLSDHRDPYARETMANLVKAFAVDAPKAKAGKMEYSNLGYAVLGQALAARWNQPWASLVETRIFEPLGFSDTTTAWTAADPKLLAPGHDDSGALVKNWTLAAYAPAGSVVSSARDLARYARAQIGSEAGGLEAAIRQSHEILAKDAGSGLESAYAWMSRVRDGGRVYWHAGGTGGYRSFLVFSPERKRAVVVLSNHSEDVSPLAMALFLGNKFESAKANASETEASAYSGRFALAPSFVLTVSKVKGQLQVQATGQPSFKLIEGDGHRFRLDGVDAALVFELDENGRAKSVVLHQHGLAQRAPRVETDVASGPVEIAIAAKDLIDYVGDYALGALRFNVKAEDSRLLVRLTGQGWAPVFPSARDQFFYKIVNAQLTFVRGEGGKVIALILHQNGVDQRAERVD